MKNLLIGTAFVLASMTAQAAGITVITSSSKTSPTTTVAMTYQKNLAGSKFYQSENCQDGVRKFTETKDSLLMFGTTLAFSAVSKGQTCYPTISDDNIVWYGEQYYKVCTKRGSGKNFRSPGATFGIPSVQLPDALVNDINTQNGTTLKALPFQGSRDTLLQVLSGDLDLGLIGTSTAKKHQDSGAMDCIASTDPSDVDYIGKQLKMKIPDLRIPVVLLKNGAIDAQSTANIKAAIDSPGFQDLLKEGNFKVFPTTSPKELRVNVDAWIDRYIKNHITNATK